MVSRRATVVSLVASCAVVVASCGSAPISLRAEPRAFTGRDYEDVYRAWTREADEFSISDLGDVLHVSATFQSWEFRWAYVVRYAEDHSMGTTEREAMLRASLEDGRAMHRFVVTLAGRNYRESDLTHERSAWRVLLVDQDGRQTTPVEVERVDRPLATDRVYFRSVTPHRQLFRVAFPVRREDGTETIPEDAREVTLRFAGAIGTVDLVWAFGAAARP